jgi:ornithine carbamoyltransferase
MPNVMEHKIISIHELSADDLREIIDLSIDIKKQPDRYSESLSGKSLLLLFQKTSTRTRVAFELGMKKLGGDAVIMDWESSNFTIAPIAYEARYLETGFNCIMARLRSNKDIRELADSVHIPVINGCCDLFHPSQVIADLMTVYELKQSFDTSICYVGVHNNVCNSLLLACTTLGIPLTLVTPVHDEIPADVVAAMERDEGVAQTLDLNHALETCEFVYTDTWINMEFIHDKAYEEVREVRIKQMLPYQVNRRLIEGHDLYVMHDMPVHPGFEIDDYAINCERSVIFMQAANRLFTAQALLLALLDAV